MLSRICAVILTHSTAPRISAKQLPVQHLVTTDVKGVPWNAVFIDTRPYSGEQAIGRHVQLAIKQTFVTFRTCEVVAVLEDDVEISDDYFSAVNASFQFLTTKEKSCFTCINDLGYRNWGRWNSSVLKPVTHSIGIGFAIARPVFETLTWGTRLWDNFLRTTAGLTCLVPEVSRCKHHASAGSTHGVGYESKRLDSLRFSGGSQVSSFVIAEPPSTDYNSLSDCQWNFTLQTQRQSRAFRGSWNGIVTQSGGETCRLRGKKAAPGLTYDWVLAERETSCTATCAKIRKVCAVAGFRESGEEQLRVLRAVAKCSSFGTEEGRDLPAVTMKGSCLVPVFGSDSSTCDHTHRETRRICPCFVPERFNFEYEL